MLGWKGASLPFLQLFNIILSGDNIIKKISSLISIGPNNLKGAPLG
jgi:hypothetical protein